MLDVLHLCFVAPRWLQQVIDTFSHSPWGFIKFKEKRCTPVKTCVIIALQYNVDYFQGDRSIQLDFPSDLSVFFFVPFSVSGLTDCTSCKSNILCQIPIQILATCVGSESCRYMACILSYWVNGAGAANDLMPYKWCMVSNNTSSAGIMAPQWPRRFSCLECPPL